MLEMHVVTTKDMEAAQVQKYHVSIRGASGYGPGYGSNSDAEVPASSAIRATSEGTLGPRSFSDVSI